MNRRIDFEVSDRSGDRRFTQDRDSGIRIGVTRKQANDGCPFLMVDISGKAECSATAPHGGMGSPKHHWVTDSEVSRCKTMYKSCPDYRTRINKRPI